MSMWHVEYTDEFADWWSLLTAEEQTDIAASVGLLEKCGPNLKHPHSSGVKGSAYAHMRELRVQHKGHPYRILYAFDPRRTAILLIGGNKKADNRWYEKYIKVADRLYEQHIRILKKEGLANE